MKNANRTRRTLGPTSLLALLVLTAGFGMLVVRATHADLEGPRERDRQVAIAVTSFLNKDHLSHRALDDEISRRCMDSFLKTLDPMKVFFTKADIDGFMRWQNSLDDLVISGNVRFAYDVYKIYLKRLDERMAVVDQLLKADHDFTVEEWIDTDFDKRPWPANAAEANDRWRKRIKYDFLIQKSAKLDDAETRKKLGKRYRTFAQNKRQTDGEELLETYLTSLTTSYDPHTSYMSPTTLENFEIMMRLQLEGIGAALQMIDGDTVVSKVIPGGAADRDGQLKREDHIIGVGQGTDGEIVDVVGMRLNDVVKKIRGKRDTIVRLQVLPGGKGEPTLYDITRAKIELKDSEARSEVIEVGKQPNGAPYRIGVIVLPSFYMDMNGARMGKPDYKSTTRDVKVLLKQFKTEGVDAVVVDLRQNGGGSLTEAINLTGLFIDQGPVVQVKDADGNVQHYDDLDAGALWQGPLVVMIDKFSASASEIFAGAIQDYRRGLIVGDHTTHGKGTVQTLLDVGQQIFRMPNAPRLGALKITMQQFYRPNGDSTQNRGVLSDIELPSITTHLDVGESDLDYAVAFDRVAALPFPKLQQVNPPMIAQLNKNSTQRRSTSEDFQKRAKRIAKYIGQKDRKRIALNEKQFLAERADLDDEEDKLKKELDPNSKDDVVVKRDYYFNEALAITLDYIQLLTTGHIAAVPN